MLVPRYKMGFMSFRLKWGFQLQSPFLTTSLSKLSSSSAPDREALFNSGRMSFFSDISEEGESCCKDTVKAYNCSYAAPQISENNLLEMEELKLFTRKRSHSSLHNSIDYTQMAIEDDKPNSHTVSETCKASHFSILMKNLDVLEDTFSDSDTLILEKNILLQLGRLGALKLFNTYLSRTLETSNFLDLPDTATDSIKEREMKDKTEIHSGNIIVHSGKKEERKLRRERASQNSERVTVEKKFLGPSFSYVKRASNYRRRRLAIARNEAEMSTGVKVAAELERIRTTLEEQSGRAASLSCWAEAAGVDEKVLQQHLHFGWYCRDELIKSTRSLVLFLARNYRGLGLSMQDLLQAGTMGILQGAERFDRTRGYRFSTYVQYWIRKSMLRMVARHSRGIQIPCMLSKAISQIQKIRKAFNISNGKYPDDDEIAKLTGISLAQIKSASKCLRVVGSIDQKTGEGLNVKYMEYMSDMSIKGPEEFVKRQHMRKEIYDLLRGLDPREKEVLILRYGLQDYPRMSLEEIGKIFHVSKEWVRKIEKKAMTKLRNEETLANLGHYLDL